MEYEVSFGQWMLNRRRELRLQRTELAAQVGCAAITLRKIETDERRPSQQLAALLAERLGLALNERTTFVRVARGELTTDHLPTLPLAHPTAASGSPTPVAATQRELIRTPVRTNLPAPLTSFVGRDQELDAIPALIENQRLVTLTGVGGVGKTRLATEVGIRMVRHGQPSVARDGIWLVELASLAEPALVAQAIARIFRLPEQGVRTTLELLQEHLAEQQLLLILDNCEHLVDVCAEIAEQLLLHCWQLHILATSREPLRVPGECAVPILPLGLPGPNELQPAQILTTTAAQLFVARMDAAIGVFASTAAPADRIDSADAAAIAQICRQLDGIPLALELAAPLGHSMALNEIAAQLQNQMAILTNTYRTAIPRHQTMYSALIWSYRLLAPEQQLLLTTVAVFAGGWTLEAAQVICSDCPAERVLPMLTQLIAKSLVLLEESHGQRRYRLLEPVRQFAQAQFQARDMEDTVRRRHLDYMLTFCEHVSPALGDNELFSERLSPQSEEDALPDQLVLYARLSDDLQNIRRALEWAMETGRVDEGLRISIAIGQLFIVVGAQHELLARFQALLGAPAPPRDAATQARACLWIAYVLSQRQSDFDLGRVWLEKAEALSAQLDNPALQFSIRFLQTQDAQLRGKYALAHTYLEQQKDLALANNYFGMGKESAEDTLVRSAGFLLLAEGNYHQVIQLCAENHARHSRLGNVHLSTGMARLLGYALLYTGAVDAAAERFRESLLGNIALGDKQAVAACLAATAALALVRGEPARAARLFGACEALQAAIYTLLVGWDAEQVRRNVITLRQNLLPPELDDHWSAGRAMSLDQAVAYALLPPHGPDAPD